MTSSQLVLAETERAYYTWNKAVCILPKNEKIIKKDYIFSKNG